MRTASSLCTCQGTASSHARPPPASRKAPHRYGHRPGFPTQPCLLFVLCLEPVLANDRVSYRTSKTVDALKHKQVPSSFAAELAHRALQAISVPLHSDVRSGDGAQARTFLCRQRRLVRSPALPHAGENTFLLSDTFLQNKSDPFAKTDRLGTNIFHTSTV